MDRISISSDRALGGPEDGSGRYWKSSKKRKDSRLYKRNYYGEIEKNGAFCPLIFMKRKRCQKNKMKEKKLSVQGSVIICNLGLGEAAGTRWPERLTREVQ
jgi:hypothetical protein